MSNVKSIFFISLCSMANAEAGTMADVSNKYLPNAVFASIEGGWTWNNLNGVNINISDVGSIYTTKHSNKGTARVSMGFKRSISNNFAALGEIGYGYYGKTTFNFHQDGPLLSSAGAPDFSQINIKSTIDGFDVLAGFSYHLSIIDLSFEAGAMIENVRYKPSINFSGIAPGNTFGSAIIDSNLTQVFPEIKIGVGYQLIDHLSLTASWMHVFGEKPSINVNINPSSPPGIIAIKTQNPTIDTFVLGASYAFPV